MNDSIMPFCGDTCHYYIPITQPTPRAEILSPGDWGVFSLYRIPSQQRHPSSFYAQGEASKQTRSQLALFLVFWLSLGPGMKGKVALQSSCAHPAAPLGVLGQPSLPSRWPLLLPGPQPPGTCGRPGCCAWWSRTSTALSALPRALSCQGS